MRSTFQNSGTALSIGVFFSLMIAGLAASLPAQLLSGLQQQGVPHAVAHHVAGLPPVSSLFAAVLGENPVAHLLAPTGALSSLSPAHQQLLTGTEFFPRLIASAVPPRPRRRVQRRRGAVGAGRDRVAGARRPLHPRRAAPT